MANEVAVDIVLNGLNEFLTGTQKASQGVLGIEDAGQQASSGLSRMWDSTKKIGGSAVRTLGRGISAVGKTAGVVLGIGATAVAGFGIAALRAGMQYNVLYQQSTAAFATVLKSQKAARDMMEQIAVFARSSPFPRQAFISATQQMLGFGVKAKKVIPYLGSIQDAVAAMGGGAQDISDLADIFSKVSAAGGLAGEDLNRLAIRGIDAATLIGKTFNLTSAQVAKGMKSGTIAGMSVLDALSASMEKTYGGAAANVKKTWVGSTDSIKGAMRDIGSALLEPFISTRGGGMAITWANELSAMLWKIKDNVIPPLADALRKIGKAVSPWIKRFTDFMSHIGPGAVNKLLDAVKQVGPQLAGIGGFFGTKLLGGLPFIGQLVGGLNPLVIGIGALIAASPELRKSLMDVVGALIPLGKLLLKVVVPLISKGLTDAVKALAPQLPPLVKAIGNVVKELLPVLPVILKMAVLLIKFFAPLLGWLAQFLNLIAPAAPYIVALAAAWWLLNVAMAANPIGLIILGIAALALGIRLLIKHWGAVKAAAGVALGWIWSKLKQLWGWVRSNWKLILVFLANPFAGAVLLIIKHRDTIWNALKAIWNWIKTVWANLGPSLVKPFKELLGVVESVPGKVGGALEKVPGVSAAEGLFGGIKHAVGRQHGGPVARGQTALVGEKGPELIHFPAGGHVTPLHEQTIRVPVYLDKRQIAEAVGQVTSDKLARR